MHELLTQKEARGGATAGTWLGLGLGLELGLGLGLELGSGVGSGSAAGRRAPTVASSAVPTVTSGGGVLGVSAAGLGSRCSRTCSATVPVLVSTES